MTLKVGILGTEHCKCTTLSLAVRPTTGTAEQQ